MWKALGVLITLVVTDFFFYPFDPFFLPMGLNTKKLMGAFGLVLVVFNFIKKKDTEIPRNIVPIFFFAGVVSLVSLASMTFNHTIDDAYSGYIVSMAVWFSSAYVVCSFIKAVHGRIGLKLLCDYLIIVSVLQCFMALAIDNTPWLKNFVDTKVVRGMGLMHELKRLYGIGCGLDTAGIHFSLCLLMITHIVKTMKETLTKWSIAYYVLCFVVLTVLGSMIARTTYVGVILSALYVLVTIDYSKILILSRGSLHFVGVSLIIVVAGVLISIFEYRTNLSFRHWMRFAFEGFFNLFERGEWSIASNDTLQGMIVFPDTLKTWIIGDGYFSNPYWSDPNFIWQGQNIGGYYKGTDIGYLRFIFYFGTIGLVVFSIFFCKCAQIACRVLPEHKTLIIFCLICGFVVWMKVATDVFFIFALFICVGNMREDEPVEELAEGEDVDDDDLMIFQR